MTIRNLILTIIAAALIAGCAEDQYSIEKQYWQAQRQAQKIFRNPEGSPPNELKRAVRVLEAFAEKHSKSPLAIEAQFRIAQLYVAKKEYDNARIQLDRLIAAFPKSATVASEALFMKGQSYQMQDKWDSALAQYRRVMREYPATLRGMDMPLYIAQYYKSKYQPDKRIEALHEAIAHYSGLASRYPNTPLAYSSDLLVVNCYVGLKDWQSAINTLNSIISKYKGKASVEPLFLDLAMIYSKELKDQAKAKEALEQLIREYPKSKLVNTANSLLNQLKKQ